MPYQADPSPAHAVQAASTPTTTTARPVVVIPAVDLFLGTVTIVARQEIVHFRHPDPHSIARALAQAVRPPRWCGASRTLTVAVAAAGKAAGVDRRFVLYQEPA